MNEQLELERNMRGGGLSHTGETDILWNDWISPEKSRQTTL